MPAMIMQAHAKLCSRKSYELIVSESPTLPGGQQLLADKFMLQASHSQAGCKCKLIAFSQSNLLVTAW